MTNLLDYLGRLHPLILHLPIGIYVLSFVLQYLKPNRIAIDDRILPILLNTGLLSACFTWFFGWLLSRDGSYGENMIFWHQWTSLAFLFSAAVVSAMHPLKSKYVWATQLYHTGFILSLFFITVAGHFGGEITHGEGFLFNESKKEFVAVDTVQSDTKGDSSMVEIPSIQPADSSGLAAAHRAGFTIRPVTIASGFIEVSAVNMIDLRNDQLAFLKPIADNILWLSLADHPLSDTGLAVIALMKNVRKVDLRKTAATDQFLSKITSLPNLEYLNLVGTNITDKGLEQLMSIKTIRHVYCWQTKITEAGVEAFHSKRPDVKIYTGAIN